MSHKAAYIVDRLRVLVTGHLKADVVEMTARQVHLVVTFDYTPPDSPDEALFVLRDVRTASYVYLHDEQNTMSLVIQPGADMMQLLLTAQLERIAESLHVPETTE